MLRRRTWATLLVLAPLAGASVGSLRAETLELVNGGQLHGELVNRDEAPRKSYVLRTAGGTVTLAPHQVRGLAEKSEAELWYETWLPEMPPDVRGNLLMAQHCKQRGLEAQRVFHLEKVLEIEPDHEEARRALGYSRIDGEWIRADIFFRQRGFVRHKGRWVLPQEMLLERAAAEQDEAERTWAKQIRMWRSWVIKRREKAPEGLAQLQAIADPAAATTLSELLNEEDEPRELKLVYVEVLGRLPGTTSTTALARRAIVDRDSKVRERAIEQLVRREDELALRLFIASLRDDQNWVINRAAAALASLQDPDATVPLIEALVTKHKFQVGGGGGQLNPTFGNDSLGGGLGGLNMGGKPRIVVKETQNMTVRDALLALHPGVNFGFDKEAWKRWLTSATTPVGLNLRRDF